MPKLTPNRSLLNPNFEGYKLSHTPAPEIFYAPLPRPVNQARAGIGSLGFQKVASRVRHNHLAVGQNGQAMYITDGGQVTLIQVEDRSQVCMPFLSAQCS